jgi:hypothetical protein
VALSEIILCLFYDGPIGNNQTLAFSIVLLRFSYIRFSSPLHPPSALYKYPRLSWITSSMLQYLSDVDAEVSRLSRSRVQAAISQDFKSLAMQRNMYTRSTNPTVIKIAHFDYPTIFQDTTRMFEPVLDGS